MHTPTHPTTDRRFVDPEELICPGCGEQVRCAPPDGHVVDGRPGVAVLPPRRHRAVPHPVRGRGRAGRGGVVTGQNVPAAGPGRMALRRVLGQGYRITGYAAATGSADSAATSRSVIDVPTRDVLPGHHASSTGSATGPGPGGAQRGGVGVGELRYWEPVDHVPVGGCAAHLLPAAGTDQLLGVDEPPVGGRMGLGVHGDLPDARLGLSARPLGVAGCSPPPP